jgi:hypothetical protein
MGKLTPIVQPLIKQAFIYCSVPLNRKKGTNVPFGKMLDAILWHFH